MFTKQDAQRLIEAFGPCSTVYECQSADELVAEFNESESHTSAGAFAAFLLSIEGIHAERFAFENGHDESTQQTRWAEWRRARTAIAARLVAAGFHADD